MEMQGRWMGVKKIHFMKGFCLEWGSKEAQNERYLGEDKVSMRLLILVACLCLSVTVLSLI